MAGREIKTKLTLEGEKQYRSAMREAASAIKVLDSELKVAEAQFKATGDAQELNSEKARILKEQIEEQKKAVEAAEKALSEMKARGVDPSSRAFQSWQTSLNNAKAKMLEMQSSLNGVEGDINGVSDTFADGAADVDNYGDALQSINSQVSFKSVADAADQLTTKIANLASFISKAALGAWSMMRDAGGWADDVMTRAQVYEMDPVQLQQWDYAARLIDTDVDTIVGARKRLLQKMNSENLDLFNQDGFQVPVYTDEGQLRDTNDVFWDTVSALGAMEDVTKRDAIAQELFGRSFDQLIPLVNAGREGWEAAAESAPVVSDENVQALADWDDAWQELDATFTTAKYELLAQFAGAFTSIAQALTDAINAFRDWSQTEEGQEALQGLGEAAQTLVETFAEDADFSVLVGKATEIVQGFTDALGWLTKDENIDKVKTALGAIAAAWALGTGGKLIASVTGGIAGLKGLIAGSAGGAAASAGTGALSSGAGTATATAVGAKTGSLLSTAGTVAGNVAVIGLPVAVAAGAVYGFNKLQAHDANKPEFAQIYGDWESADAHDTILGNLTDEQAEAIRAYWQVYEDAGSEAAMDAREAVVDAFAEGGVMRPEDATTLVEDTFDQALNGMDTDGTVAVLAEKIPGIFEQAFEEAVKSGNFHDRGFSGLESLDVSKLWNDVGKSRGFSGLESVEVSKLWNDVGKGRSFTGIDSLTAEDFMPTEETYREGIAQWTAQYGDAAAAQLAGLDLGPAFSVPIEQAQGPLPDQSAQAGQATGQGFANGLYDMGPAVAAAAAYLANISQSTLRSVLGIASPSKVMAELGGYTAEGFAEGIEDSVWRVERATSRMVDATQQTPTYGRAGAGGGADGGDIRAYIVMDKEIVGELVAPVVDGYIGASILDVR